MPKIDVLVLGSGIAGLTYALKIAECFPEQKIVILTKGDESESNTKYAQGGIATVIDTQDDSYEKHISDTIKAGDGLCNPQVVQMVVEEGPKRLYELINWGINFDKSKLGKYDLGLEGGHSEHRILHFKDITGYEIERKLIIKIKQQQNITLLTSHFAVDLITEHQLKRPRSKQKLTCYGAYVFNQKTQKIVTYNAKTTLLATGGIGQVYRNTTNPIIATGDGIAMAYRAKAQVSHMEFIQFHPTALAHQFSHGRSFLISEAVRGLGAILKNEQGEAFMHKYDARKELASRDIVSRAIDNELKISGADFVYLDCTSISKKDFKRHFPNIYAQCIEIGIDLSKQMIPVTPAAHYLCGGIEVDINGCTSVQYLYACGECAHTGLHGANRLASNSLLEALVYAHRCFIATKKNIETIKHKISIPDWDVKNTFETKEQILITHNRKELQSLMSDYVGIIRTHERLLRASKRLNVLFEETEDLYQKSKLSTPLFELRNMISTSYLIVEQSIKRVENKGGFYNSDLI